MTDQTNIDVQQSTTNVNFSVSGTHVDTNIRILGQVKWFNTKSGFGFITVCKKEPILSDMDIFVHYSSLNVINNQYRYLVQGEYVEFNVVKPDNDKYEFHAVNVSGVQGGTIMCEIRRLTMDSKQHHAQEVIEKKTLVKQSHYVNNDFNELSDEIYDYVKGKEYVVRKNHTSSSYPRKTREIIHEVERPPYQEHIVVYRDSRTNDDGDFQTVRRGKNRVKKTFSK